MFHLILQVAQKQWSVFVVLNETTSLTWERAKKNLLRCRTVCRRNTGSFILVTSSDIPASLSLYLSLSLSRTLTADFHCMVAVQKVHFLLLCCSSHLSVEEQGWPWKDSQKRISAFSMVKRFPPSFLSVLFLGCCRKHCVQFIIWIKHKCYRCHLRKCVDIMTGGICIIIEKEVFANSSNHHSRRVVLVLSLKRKRLQILCKQTLCSRNSRRVVSVCIIENESRWFANGGGFFLANTVQTNNMLLKFWESCFCTEKESVSKYNSNKHYPLKFQEELFLC